MRDAICAGSLGDFLFRGGHPQRKGLGLQEDVMDDAYSMQKTFVLDVVVPLASHVVVRSAWGEVERSSKIIRLGVAWAAAEVLGTGGSEDHWGVDCLVRYFG